MSLAFQDFLRRRGTEAIEEVARLALFFFTDQYVKWLSRGGISRASTPLTTDQTSEEALPSDEVYFILAGYSFRDRTRPYPLHLFSSEGERMAIRSLPASHVVVVPRSLSMEKKLEAQRETGSPLDLLLSLSKSFLKKRSGEEEEVGPPFFFATITPSGYHEVAEAEVKG